MRAGWFVLACAVPVLAGAWMVGNALTASTNAAVEDFSPPAQTIALYSTDGVRLAGTYWPAPLKTTPAILLLHGNGSNRGAMAQMATWLNDQGYAVLAIDFRGHGQSAPAPKSFGLMESRDARAAFDWLKARHANVGVIGYSLGGAAALLGKDGPLPADALVLIAVYPDIRHAITNRLAQRVGAVPAALLEPLLSFQSLPRYGVWPSQIAPLQALAGVREPVLIAGSTADANTPAAETRAMFKATGQRGELALVDGLSHDALGGELPQGLKRQMLAFLNRNLRTAR